MGFGAAHFFAPHHNTPPFGFPISGASSLEITRWSQDSQITVTKNAEQKQIEKQPIWPHINITYQAKTETLEPTTVVLTNHNDRSSVEPKSLV